jgi:Cu/Zn superoxide dismutase
MIYSIYIETLHGPPDADRGNRHVGDFGNVTANGNGIIIVEITDPIADLYNAERSIANRTIVLHAIRDDGGTGGFPDSKTTGYLFNMMKSAFFLILIFFSEMPVHV